MDRIESRVINLTRSEHDPNSERNPAEGFLLAELMTTSGSTTTPASTDNFRVAVRIRPLLPIDNKIANYAAAVTDMEECESTEDSLEDNSAGGSGGGGGGGSARLVRPVDPKMLVFGGLQRSASTSSTARGSAATGFRSLAKEIKFAFDRVFDETCSQQLVYEDTAKTLLPLVLKGINATVFAYGATGCGKTHTITGSPSDPGVIYRTMHDLFDLIGESSADYATDVAVSYLEVYNETIRDLLLPEGKLSAALDLREGETIVVAGLSQHKPKTRDDVMRLLLHGNNNRTKAPTEANAVSSRSHAVLQIHVKRRSKMIMEDSSLSAATSTQSATITNATLSIIDLAGSERASVTKNKGERLLEGANINRSLLALGNCINALCSEKTSQQHIPYRDSKLTRLLKHSLGGNCKVVMIVNVSPAPIHYEETLNTLKYANRAKNIKTRAVANSVQVDLHVTQYTRIISELRHKIALLESSASSSTSDVTMDKIPIPPSSVTTAPTSTSTYQHIFDPALLESSLVHIQGIMSKYFQKITQKSLESAAAQVAIDMNELRVSHLKSILALVSKATTTTPSTHIAITQDSRVSSLREQILKSIDDLHTANAALRHVVSREEFAVCQMDEKMLSKIDKIKVQLVVKKTSTSSSPHQPQQLQPLLNNPLDDDIAKRMNIQWSMLKNIVFDRKQAITKECYSTCLLQIESFTSVAFHLIYSDEASLLDLWQIVQEIVSSPPLFCGTTAGQIVPVTAETDILDVMSEGDASFCSSVAPGGFGDEDGDGLVMKTGVGGVGVIDEMDDVDVDIMPVIEESLFNACRDTVGVGVGSEPAIVRKISSLSLHATPNTTIPAVADEDAGEDDDGGKTPSTVKAIKSRNLLEQENTNNIQQHSPVPPTSEFISDQHELEQLHPSLKRKKTIGSNSIADNINNNHNNSSNSARKSKKARVTIYSTSRSGRHHHHSKNSRLHDDFSGAEADVSKAENETDEDLAANDDSSTDEYIATIGGKNENTTPTLSRMAANAAAVNGLDKIIGNFMKNPVVTSGSGALVKKGSVHNVPTPLPVKFVFSPKIMPGTSLSSSMSLTASQAALMASPRVQASFGSTSLTAASSSVNTAPTSDSSSSGAGPIRCSPARRDKRNNHRSSMIPILKGNGSPLTTPFVANNTNGGGGVGSPLVPKAAAGGASTVTRRGITFYSPKVLRSSASSRIMRGSSTSGGGGGGSHSPSKSNKQRVSSLHLSSSLKASSSRKPAAASSSTASNPFTSSSSSSSIVKKQPQPQHQQQQILRKHKSTPSMRPRKESTSTATTDQEPMYSRESSVAAASDAESFKGVGNVKRITRSTAITGSTGRVGLLGGSGLNRRK